MSGTAACSHSKALAISGGDEFVARFTREPRLRGLKDVIPGDVGRGGGGSSPADPRSREAFLLRYGEGLDYAEISRMCGDGISALKMRVKRARERLRAFIEEPPDVR